MFGFTRMTAVLGVVALTITGCDEAFVNEDPSLLSAEETTLRNIERQRRQTATAVGAGLGMLVGAVVTRDQPREDRIRGILIGAIGGALAGRATGDYVNTRTRAISNQQQGLRSLIAAADRDIASYRRLNNVTARLITQQRREINQLNRQLSSGTQTVDGYRAQIAAARNNIRSLDTGIEDITKQIGVMKADLSALNNAGRPTTGLANRIASLEEQKRVLQSRRRALANIYDEVPDSVGTYDF